MLALRWMLVCFLGFALTAPVRPADAQSTKDALPPDSASLTIAIADFTGADKELGRFLAETVLTELAQSDRLRLVERGEIRQALTELKLQNSGLTEPGQIKKLGQLMNADRLIVGSYLVRDDKIIVNARLLDIHTGKLAPGGAASVSGSKDDLLTLCARLAKLFHKRVTGEELRLEGDPSSAEPGVEPAAPVTPQTGWIPANVRPNDLVHERDLAALVARAAAQLTAQSPVTITVTEPKAAVSRLRVLTALLRLTVPQDRINEYRADADRPKTPDDALTPTWGQPYVSAAITEGWWHDDAPFHAREAATWAFVSALIEKLPLDANAPAEAPRAHAGLPAADPNAYTGLIVDANPFPIERAMSPRIFDESGNQLYPDLKRLPDYDFLLDKGLAAYCTTANNAPRAGNHPLIVRALNVVGSSHADIVVSSETAERIRDANRHGGFIFKWAVCILSEKK